MDGLLEGIAAAVDGVSDEQTLFGGIALLVALAVRRKVVRTLLAFVQKVSSCRVTIRLRHGSLLVDLKAAGWGLWLWLNIYYKRR